MWEVFVPPAKQLRPPLRLTIDAAHVCLSTVHEHGICGKLFQDYLMTSTIGTFELFYIALGADISPSLQSYSNYESRVSEHSKV